MDSIASTSYVYSIIFYLLLWKGTDAQWWLFSRVLTVEKRLNDRNKSACYRFYLNDRQLNTCLKDPSILTYIGKGTMEAIDACQDQFYNERWNCTNNNYNKRLYKKKTPETAYINAISSAGVAHKVTELCDRGVLKECGCKHTLKQKKSIDTTDPENPFYWTYCNSHIKYGMRISKIFLDPSKEETIIDKYKRNIKKLMIIQNNKAARKLLWEFSQQHKKCACHGPTGHCLTRTCYRWLPELKEIAQILHFKYYSAIEVKLKNMRKLTPVSERKTLERTDLVYTERLNYCSNKSTLGIPGTKGRVCLNKEPASGNDMTSCNILCCERGYLPLKRKIKVGCHCKSIWCCRVTCDTCEKEVIQHVCK